jgi:aldehyde:ferredoxin oxidoreductase
MTPERFEGLFGADYTDLLDVGSRVVDLERHFNNQRGIDRSDDRLPYSLPDFEAALDEYYERRGWTDDGVVPEGRVNAAASAD